MSELLFEGFQVPSVTYANDGLSSLFGHRVANNLSSLGDALVISAGASCTVITPVIDGKAVLSNSKRSANF